MEKGTFISSVSDCEEEYYLNNSSWSGVAADWKQRFEVGDVVADPAGDWEPSTAEEYIDQQVATEAATRLAQDTYIQSQIPLADEEDLTKNGQYLKFKDRTYNQISPNGMGRVILRNNIVNGVNTLTQSMINQTNTIYVIRYDFTLGEDITIPANCILEFDGGSLSNGTLIGNNTMITASDGINIFNSLLFDGTFDFGKVSVKWFGAKGDNENIDDVAIQSAIDFAIRRNKEHTVYFPAGTYLVNNTININYSIPVELVGCSYGQNKANSTIMANSTITDMFSITVSSVNIIVRNLAFDGNRTGTYYNNGVFNYELESKALNCFNFSGQYGATYSLFEGLYFTGFNGFAIINLSYGSRVNNTMIKRCGYGIRLSTPNNTCICNCNIDLIGYVGIVGKAASTTIRNNTFDGNGQCAIATFSGIIDISNNYFEACSKTGFHLKDYNNVILIDGNNNPITFHACICIVGNTDNILNTDTWKLQRNYPIVASSICNNDLDWADSFDNKYFIIAATLKNTVITGNQFRYTDFNAIIGFIDNDSTSISEVNISNNNNSTIPRIAQLNFSNTSIINNGANLYGIYTTDDISKQIYNIDLRKKLYIRGYDYDATYEYFDEQDFKYEGNRVFKKRNATKIQRLIMTLYDRGTDVPNIQNPEPFINKIWVFSFYSSPDGITWTKRNLHRVAYALSSGPVLSFPASANYTYITLPKVDILGEYPCINDIDWVPNNDTITIKYVIGSKLNVGEEYLPYISGQIIKSYNGNNAIKVSISNGIKCDKSVFDNWSVGMKNGLWIIDETTNKPIYWNGTAWVDSTGATV